MGSRRTLAVLCPCLRRASSAPGGLMRAVQTYQYGGVDDLLVSDSCRRPAVAAPDEVLVRVRAASINPMDLAMLGGYGSRAFAPLRRCAEPGSATGGQEFPLTLGRDLSGEVVAVGRCVDASRFRPGQPVFGALWPFRSGSHCDFVSVRAGDLAPKPDAWDHVTAAALPYAGLTAFSALVDTGGLRRRGAGETSVLVVGASGGVGSVAVQLCAAWGAHVVATAHADAQEFVQSLGAHCVVNADACEDGKALLEEVVEASRGGKGYDIVLDGVGVEEMAGALRRGALARYVTLRGSLLHETDALGPVMGVASAGLRLLRWNAREVGENQRLMTWGFFRASGRNLRLLAELGEKGLMQPMVDSVFPLEEAKEAYTKVQRGGVRGKVVLKM